jgi:ApaG protein
MLPHLHDLRVEIGGEVAFAQGLDAGAHFGQNRAMYRAVTKNIEITVEPDFLEDRSDPRLGRFFWAYTIEIANKSGKTVQLLSRHWQITDANGKQDEVKGAGVVGEQPILREGESFRYTSGCPLGTPSGFMVGTYQMVDETGEAFEVEIPAFSLDSPHVPRVLN